MTKQRAIVRAVVKIMTVAESIDIPPVQRGILAAALRDLIEASSAEPEAPQFAITCSVAGCSDMAAANEFWPGGRGLLCAKHLNRGGERG